jgi:N4-bis(aminopropyl)spermidine synthase
VKTLISQLKRNNIHLKEAEIEGLLYLFVENSSISNNELIRATGLPKETLREFKSSLGNYLEEKKSKVSLNAEGKKLLKDTKFRPYAWSLFSFEDEEVVARLNEIRKKHSLNPVREYDQWFATAETSVNKAKALVSKGLGEGKNIALFGDDDLVSITLVLMGVKFSKITVFDIDKNLLSTLEKILNDLKVKNVFTVLYDARDEFDAKDLETYDVVLTDPPYTRTGVALFLDRAIQLLKPSKDFSGSYIFLNYGNSFKSPEKLQKVQEIINDFGLVIEDRIDKFARYHGAESIGSASSLYVLKTTPSTSSKNGYFNNRIYTYETIKEEKFPYVDHFVFKLHGVPNPIVTSKTALQKAVGEFCKKHKLKVVGSDITKFKPHGYTITLILSNSNLLLHTWPEHNAIHIDLVTCSPIHEKEGMITNLQRLFSVKNIEVKKVE